MTTYKETELIRGWFVGDFSPSCFKTQAFEAAIKRYKQGDYEHSHHHKVATEITFIVSGHVKMNQTHYKSGDIIIIHPNECTDFYAITDTITSVIKIPCAKNDKYTEVQ